MPPTRTLTRNQKEKILERDGYVCIYCLEDATVVDHIVPWSWSYDDSPFNLVAACELCNAIAHDKIFRSLGEKTAYIMKQRDKRQKANPYKLEASICPGCDEGFSPLRNGNTSVLCEGCANKYYIDFSVLKLRKNIETEYLLRKEI